MFLIDHHRLNSVAGPCIAMLLPRVLTLLFGPSRSLDANLSPYPQPRPEQELANGLRYYIQPHSSPMHHASLRLVVKVGSFVEEDHEQGASHLYCVHTSVGLGHQGC